MLELRNISFGYYAKNPVINNVSLRIAAGEFLAIAGRNGSGKTTLTRLIMALKKPSAGEIVINDNSAKNYTPADVARFIGYVFQNPDRQIFRDTVISETAYGPEQLGYSPADITRLVADALAATGLTDHANAYPPILSRGQKQRLAIASALAMRPQMLILDEPTSGQDAREKTELMDLLTNLNNKGLTIMLITHDMDLLSAYAKRVIVMDKGSKAFDGSVSDLFDNTDSLKQWGLTEPTAVNISHSLTKFGIAPTASISELTGTIIDIMGGKPHAKDSTAY